MNKQVSIIIPYYNCIDKLLRLLNSIGKNEEIEIIVIDDHSQIEISQKIKEAYTNVYFLRNQKNSGAGFCRNRALRIATGKWILFADADDYFVENFYYIISKYLHMDYDIVYFSPISIFEDTQKTSDRHLVYQQYVNDFVGSGGDENSILYLKYRFFAPWSKLIKRDLVIRNRIQFDETMVSNDVMFSTYCGFYAEKICADASHIYCVTRDKGSLTARADYFSIKTRVDVAIRYNKFISTNLSQNKTKLLELYGGMYLYRTFFVRHSISQTLKLSIAMKKGHMKLIPHRSFKQIMQFYKEQKIFRKYIN